MWRLWLAGLHLICHQPFFLLDTIVCEGVRFEVNNVVYFISLLILVHQFRHVLIVFQMPNVRLICFSL